MRTPEVCAHPPAARARADARIDALLGFAFGSAVAGTVWSCRSMATMGALPMPGGWSMSAVWMPMCGQTWLGAATAFIGMWTVMMTAMMLPSSAPQWRRHGRRTLGSRHSLWLALIAAAVYLAVWALGGTLVFCAGNAFAASLPHASAVARAVPLSSGLSILLAGAVQFTAWKRQRVTCPPRVLFYDPDRTRGMRAACRFGLRLAMHEAFCCANLMAVVLAIGVMDLRVMAAMTAAATAERLSPSCRHTGRAIGAAIVATGMLAIARAAPPAFL